MLLVAFFVQYCIGLAFVKRWIRPFEKETAKRNKSVGGISVIVAFFFGLFLVPLGILYLVAPEIRTGEAINEYVLGYFALLGMIAFLRGLEFGIPVLYRLSRRRS